jgi:hypothetical protein
MPELMVLHALTQAPGFNREMLGRAADSAIASMSTSGLALFSGVAYAIYKLILSYRKDGWAGMRNHFIKDVFHGLIFGACWWIILFSYHLWWRVPSEIRQEADNAVVPPSFRALPIPPQAYQTTIQPTITDEVPTVEVSYSSGLLPVRIPPYSCATILVLNRKVKDFPDSICSHGSEILYPYYRLPKDDHSQIQYLGTSTRKGGSLLVEAAWFDMGVCEFTNHSDKDLINVKMTFYVSFRRSKSVYATHHAQDAHNDSFTFKIADAKDGGSVWIDYDPKTDKVQGWTYDKDVSNQKKVVVIRSILAHQTATIYIVTKSHYPVRFDLPQKGTALVSGEVVERGIKLIRPVTTIFDKFPWWGMPPSKYKWPNMPSDD